MKTYILTHEIKLPYSLKICLTWHWHLTNDQSFLPITPVVSERHALSVSGDTTVWSWQWTTWRFQWRYFQQTRGQSGSVSNILINWYFNLFKTYSHEKLSHMHAFNGKWKLDTHFRNYVPLANKCKGKAWLVKAKVIYCCSKTLV